jgi:hypothetical protein
VLVLGDALLRIHIGEMAELDVAGPRVVSEAGPQPEAGRYARLQAVRGDPDLTSLGHTRVQIEDPVARRLIGLLDGTRDREALAAALGAAPGAVEAALRHLARLALLEA